jgi:hypothetical protein
MILTTYDLWQWKSVQQESSLYNFFMKVLTSVFIKINAALQTISISSPKLHILTRKLELQQPQQNSEVG